MRRLDSGNVIFNNLLFSKYDVYFEQCSRARQYLSEVTMSFSFFCCWLLSLLPQSNECNFVFQRDARRVYRQNLRTTECAVIDTKERFELWQEANEGTYVSMSEEGRNLLLAYIEAMHCCMYLCSVVPLGMARKLAYLMSLLTKFPPQSPISTSAASIGRIFIGVS